MRVYASGTLEARELLNELEYLWEQIKDLPSSDEELTIIIYRYLQDPRHLVKLTDFPIEPLV